MSMRTCRAARFQFHAMRGISAHSNGFQTARALHLLQILLGSVETPGGYRLKPPYPKPIEAHPTPHFVTTPGKPLTGRIWAMSGPDDLALRPTAARPGSTRRSAGKTRSRRMG
jgi:anaerobic selenocysteine-containing dehydrogenase